MAGDELLKVDDQQAAATVAGVNMQLAHALKTKPTVLNGEKRNREREE
jgi:heme exporter protein D